MQKILILLLVAAMNGNSQIYVPIAFPEKVNERYIINPLKEQEKYQKKLRKKIPKKHLENFTVATTFDKARKFSTGEIYLSWAAMEDYLNQILDSILPANLKSKNIRVFVGRSSDINAFCLYDGTIVINAGLLAEVKSEAALATVMGHELSHFIKNHLIEPYKKQKKSKKTDRLKHFITASGFSQQHELDADKLGLEMAANAGYDANEGLSIFELFAREREYINKRHKSSLASIDSLVITTSIGKVKVNTLEKLLSSHPDIQERRGHYSTALKTVPTGKKQRFKMDEDLFRALQHQARLESVNLMFDRNNYMECLERAFTYHLFHPQEINYSYYVAESVRRLCLLDYRLRKKGFLAQTLIQEGFKEGEGILKDLRYIVPNAELFADIQARELLSAPRPFDTYTEAFLYFTKKLEEKKYTEVYLMRGLFENNAAKRKAHIDKYLAGNQIRHREYATHFLNNSLVTAITQHTGEIVMIPQVSFFRNQTNGDRGFYYRKSEIAGKEMANAFTNGFNKRFGHAKTISMPLAATQNFNTKYKYETMLGSSFLARRDENEGYEVVHYYKELEDEDYIGKTDIFRLNPEIWEFFNSNRINTVSVALYERFTSAYAQRMKIVYLFFGPAGWLTSLATVANYKQLTVLSYDAKLGAVYWGWYYKKFRLTTGSALRMFRKVKQSREKYIEEYNQKF